MECMACAGSISLSDEKFYLELSATNEVCVGVKYG